MKKNLLLFGIILFTGINIFGQFVSVGSGSYTTTFPGVDAAARNGYPSGTPPISGNAAGKPVPTNDWWSSLLKNDFVSNLFNYPLAMRTVNAGLVVSYIVPGSGPNGSSAPMDDVLPVTVGVTGLNATKCTVSDYSDWTVTMSWNDASHSFNATAGIAMPFLYYTKKATDIAQINIISGSVVISNEMLIITDAKGGADFAVYAPSGSTWTKTGTVYTSNLNGQNYWSMAYIPPTASTVAACANEYKKYAYVFPSNTTVNWNYNETNSVLTTTFTVTKDIKEGTDTTFLMGLLPHQWANLSASSPVPAGYSYPCIRGEIKTMAANSFEVENTFYGILPTLPYLDNYSEGFSPATLNEKVTQLENDGLATWTDSYNEGQVMNRLIQTARIADQMGNTVARDKMVATVKARLEDWLKAESGEVAFIFYYNAAWSALLGYPAGHMQDSNLNDHHFHWGYFIHAAAFIEQFSPGWASQWGSMINLLVRDAASADRSDPKFPFLRSFSPYAGHCWANGFATFPFGNDQESTSESMQFNSSLIHWGTVTGNKEIRDLGIYLYTTEQTAIEEYWLDVHERNFKAGYNFSLCSRIWGNGYDNQTFWTGDIEAAYGIEMYPFHGGSLYLGQDTVYAQKLWDEITVNTGILTNEANPNLWHDVMWEYLSFINPQAAINLYNSNPDRSLKFGISDAQTYYWLHSMNAIGRVASITADYPVAAAFFQNGITTYVAHNYSDSPITVTFSDGYALQVPAKKMASSKDVDVSGVIVSDFARAFPQGSVNLSVEISGSGVTKVEFLDGNQLIGSQTEAPFTQKAANLELGIHKMYARVFKGELFNITNIIDIQVGNQVPYSGSPMEIPGVIEAGFYDKFEGGVGQGISYVDVSLANEGDFRIEEYVDAGHSAAEGATIGWISAGEWLEYSVDVKTAGKYSLTFRYASGNSAGGGPFHLELDGKVLSANIPVPTTGKWETWASKTITNLDIPAGKHILKLFFESGEFNLGKMTFAYTGAPGYLPPLANAGSNVKVLLPATTAVLDGSLSSDPESQPLSYSWEQNYGPSTIIFSDKLLVSPEISNLEAGVYQCRLTVSDGTYTSFSDVLVIVTDLANLEPYVSITAPANNSSYYESKSIVLGANAIDLDGSISLVEFFDGANKIGEATAAPFTLTWATGSIDNHSITAKATDDAGASTISAAITVVITSAPSCEGGPVNNDYKYRFTPDKSNPTLTFVPSAAAVGSPTCILYYGSTASGPYPGINVLPNVPYKISATEGSTVYFYYTYSYPGGERNTSAAMHTYEIGSCGNSSPFLTVLTTSLAVNAAANSKGTFTIDTNVECTVVSDQSWLTISKSPVSVFTTITATAAVNQTAIQRTAKITVSGAGVTTKTVTVKQAAGSMDVEQVSEDGITVYPVPVSDRIYISGLSRDTNAGIYNICGNLMLTAKLSNSANEVDLSQLAKGIYFIKLQTDSGIVVRQFVKQ
jgi:endoglucanase Acf2